MPAHNQTTKSIFGFLIESLGVDGTGNRRMSPRCCFPSYATDEADLNEAFCSIRDNENEKAIWISGMWINMKSPGPSSTSPKANKKKSLWVGIKNDPLRWFSPYHLVSSHSL